MTAARITVTLPPELVSEIDRRERNRSRFVVEAVRREVLRRKRDEMRRSLENPHPDSSELADAGLEEWGRREKAGDDTDLLDWTQSRRVRWIEGRGWIEDKK
jgi:hypothetical protein